MGTMTISGNIAAGAPRRKPGRNRRLAVLVAPILVLALAASGCSQASDDGSAPVITADADGRVRLDFVNQPPGDPVPGGSLSFGLSAETDGWNVTAGRWASSAYIVGNAIFDPLAAYDANYEPQPYLAESFTSNADFTTWTITLRPGVQFHDGSPVNAEVVAANLTAHTKAALTSPAVSFIDTVSVASELEVEVTMIKPWSTFPNTLTTQIGYVMAQSMIDDPDGARNPVGSGPFVFQQWTPGQSLKTTKNDNYWRDGLPYLDAVEFQVLPDIQTRNRALDAGQIQAMQTADASQILRFAESASEGNVQMYSDDNAEVDETFIALNVSKPPFDDPLAREALAYSVDRQALTDQAYEGLFPPAVGPYQPSSDFYVDAGVPEFNPDKARELVAQYEAKYGTKLAFSANILPVPEVRRIGETLQQQAADVGIEVTLDAMDQATLIVRAVTGDYQATGFILFGQPLLDSEYVFIADYPEGNPLNFTRNKNPRIVEALDAARATTDRSARAEAYAEVQRQMATDGNFVFTVHNLSAVVYANNVYGIADWSLPSGDAGGRTIAPRLMEAWVSN
jgi:peptide/nickel transport system substrate-binding protein